MKYKKRKNTRAKHLKSLRKIRIDNSRASASKILKIKSGLLNCLYRILRLGRTYFRWQRSVKSNAINMEHVPKQINDKDNANLLCSTNTRNMQVVTTEMNLQVTENLSNSTDTSNIGFEQIEINRQNFEKSYTRMQTRNMDVVPNEMNLQDFEKPSTSMTRRNMEVVPTEMNLQYFEKSSTSMQTRNMEVVSTEMNLQDFEKLSTRIHTRNMEVVSTEMNLQDSENLSNSSDTRNVGFEPITMNQQDIKNSPSGTPNCPTCSVNSPAKVVCSCCKENVSILAETSCRECRRGRPVLKLCLRNHGRHAVVKVCPCNQCVSKRITEVKEIGNGDVIEEYFCSEDEEFLVFGENNIQPENQIL